MPMIRFENLGLCFYQRCGFRPPKAGEYYLSDEIVQAYQAPYDLTMAYQIVKPTHYAVKTTVYEKGEEL